MSRNNSGELRRSAAVSTYGPGAIMDMRADEGRGGPVAGVAAGLEEWELSAPLTDRELTYQVVHEPRLGRKLRKRKFRLAPVVGGSKSSSTLVIRRFPEWLQCPSCDVIAPSNNWASDPGKASKYCASCTNKKPSQKPVFVAPVRFVAACEAGHLEDFPWHYWVRHQSGCKFGKLTLRSEGPGLGGLWVSCPNCKARRSFDSAFSSRALSGLHCRGKRPWLQQDDVTCSCTGENGDFRVVQRGASNLYYPVIESALTIPPWTDSIETELGDYWDDLSNCVDDENRRIMIEATPSLGNLCIRLGLSSAELAVHVTRRVLQLDEGELGDLRHDEYRIFTEGRKYLTPEFEIHPQEINGRLSSLINNVVRISRLREIRVLRGFTRIHPPMGTESDQVAPLSVTDLDWLPATELRGEGLFMSFNEESIATWERLPHVKSRTMHLQELWQAEWKMRGGEGVAPERCSPRFLLLHTFAHALIEHLTLECGYSTASIRERIYAESGSFPMAGLLIYTGTSDSEGTLGGLQSRARMDLLENSIAIAVSKTEWCSADPLCASGSASASDHFSIASCHSCVLLPETSCEFNNRFLDRILLCGSDEDPSLGYFNQWV